MSQASKDKSLGVSLVRSSAGPDMIGLSKFGVPDVSDGDALLCRGMVDGQQSVSVGQSGLGAVDASHGHVLLPCGCS